jgi:hypothetical protein
LTECPPEQLSGSFFECIKTVWNEYFLVIVPHLPCSPDLAPSDFWLFDHIKTFLAGCVVNAIDELLEAVIEF